MFSKTQNCTDFLSNCIKRLQLILKMAIEKIE